MMSVSPRHRSSCPARARWTSLFALFVCFAPSASLALICILSLKVTGRARDISTEVYIQEIKMRLKLVRGNLSFFRKSVCSIIVHRKIQQINHTHAWVNSVQQISNTSNSELGRASEV